MYQFIRLSWSNSHPFRRLPETVKHTVESNKTLVHERRGTQDAGKYGFFSHPTDGGHWRAERRNEFPSPLLRDTVVRLGLARCFESLEHLVVLLVILDASVELYNLQLLR